MRRLQIVKHARAPLPRKDRLTADALDHLLAFLEETVGAVNSILSEKAHHFRVNLTPELEVGQDFLLHL